MSKATPATFRKIVAHTYSTNFRQSTRIETVPFPAELKPTELLVRNRFVGINASDINFTAGVYQPDVKPPFDCGFEAVGEVVEVGTAVTHVKVGEAVVTQCYGAFADYQVVPQRHAKAVPSLQREWLPLDLSGTTASIALEKVLKPEKGERAIVTAASGGTGHFAVQLLKHVYGCQVLGTCSSASKAAMLQGMGCDTVVNYRDVAEKGLRLSAAIREVYPTGAHVAYESVGGEMLDTVVNALALRGRVLSIGSISTYTGGETAGAAAKAKRPLPLRLLSKSATLHTFFLPHYVKYAPAHFAKLCALYEKGVIHPHIDPTPFKGLEAVADAIDAMYARKNNGKLIVEL